VSAVFRLSKPELTEERFTVSKGFDLDRELSGSLGVFKGSDDYQWWWISMPGALMTCEAGDGIRVKN